MKNKSLIYITILLAFVAVTSCKKALEEEVYSQIYTEKFYNLPMTPKQR